MKLVPLAVGVCCWLGWLAAGLAQDASPTPAPALPPVVARYEQMLIASPGKGTAFDKVYQHFFENEGLDALAARWHSRADAAPGTPGADVFLLLEGLLAERRARPDDARERYTAYTRRLPADPRGWTALGELETAEGHFGASAEALAHALDPKAKPPVPPAVRPTLYRELARAQTRDFQIAAAMSTWRKLAAEFPDDPTVLQEVGEAFQEGQAFDDARDVFQKLRDLAGRNGDAFGRINATLHLGQVEEARGNAQEAVKVYEGVVADAKAGSWLEREARARIEQLYRGQEDLPGLADYYKKWLDDHPRDLEVATRRAAVLIELNRRDEAIDLLRQAVGWAPDRQELQVELARRLAESGRPAEAVAVMEKLTVTAPEEKSYWVLLGDARWQLLASDPAGATSEQKARWRKDALDAWSHLAPADSRDGEEVGTLADLLAARRLPDEALAQYARAAALAPELPDLRERWAAYLAGLGRRDEARRVLAGIVTASPKNATAANYARLATALDRLDDLDGALDATENGIALAPRDFDLLTLRWQLLAARKRWDDALALYPALLAAAPSAYYVEQVQTRHVTALAAAGKLADFRKALAARLPTQTAPLDENELALLIRADLQSAEGAEGDAAIAALAEAHGALEQGEKRFPRSVVLVRAEIELARRARDATAQVAALRKLAELQPAQKSDVLEQIVRVWRDSDHPAEALAAARELVAASPANTAAQLLLADLLLASDHPEAGLAALREAVRLSDKPNDIRLRLARAQADLGKNADARKTLDEAFEAAADARERLALTKPLAEAYQRDGKLDELIARFERLQQADADGWRYALYLANIYEETQDTAGARRELAKALLARPKDGSLLREIVRLAAEDSDTAELARYQRQLAEAEPTDGNQLGLVKALLSNDEADAALETLRTHLAGIIKTPGAWDELLPLLTQKELTGKVGDLLARELGGEKADPRNRLTLALFQMCAGRFDDARPALWSVFAMRSPRTATPAAPPPATPVPSGNEFMVFYGEGGTLAEARLANAVAARATAQALIDPATAGQQTGTSTLFSGAAAGPAAPGQPDPVDTARDTALVYLAAIAFKQDAAPAFLAELDRQLAARESSRADRLVAYASVDAQEPLMREIAAQARQPEEGLDVFCAGQLFTAAFANQQNTDSNPEQVRLTPAQIGVMVPAAEAIFPRVLRTHPETASVLDVIWYTFYKSLDVNDKATAVRRAFLERTDERSSITQLTQAVGLLLEGEMSPEDRARLRTVARALGTQIARQHNATTRQELMYLPQSIFQTNIPAAKLPPDEFADLLADLLFIWYPPGEPPPPAPPAPSTPSMPSAFMGGFANGSNANYLPPTHFFESDAQQAIQQLAAQLHGDEKRPPALHARLERQARELPPAQAVYPLLVSVYVDFWNEDKPAALAGAQALLAAHPDDDDLRLLAAILLGRNDQPAEAVALLKKIKEPRDADTARLVQGAILAFAREAEDNGSARAAAQRLVALRVPPDERQNLASILREIGLEAEAKTLESLPGTPGAPGTRPGRTPTRTSVFDYETVQQLQAMEKQKDEGGVLTLARIVLAALPPPTQNADQAEVVISAVVETLDRLHKKAEFIAAAQKQLAGDPDSLSLNYQLAVLNTRPSMADFSNGQHIKKGVKVPVWVRLTRHGDEIAGAFSRDGKTWEELGRESVSLGGAPLAVLPLTTLTQGGSSEADRLAAATVDGIGLAPEPGGPVPATPDAATLPIPWTAGVIFPGDGFPTPTFPRMIHPQPVVPLPTPTPPANESSARNGVFTLRGKVGALEDAGDRGIVVSRPLGAAEEFTARVASFAEDSFEEESTGVMMRASLAPDAPFAAVLAGKDGSVLFACRPGVTPSLAYWRKLAALRPKEARYARLLADQLAASGERAAAMDIYDRLLGDDPAEFSRDYLTVYGGDLPRLAARLLAWEPSRRVSGNGNVDPESMLRDTAAKCVEAKRDDLAVALCRRGLEWAALSGDTNTAPELHQTALAALVRLGRRDEARDELVKLFVPPSAPKTADARGPKLGFTDPQESNSGNMSSSWFYNLSWNDDSPVMPGLTALETARPLGLLPELEAAINARLAEPDAKGFPDDGLQWLVVLCRLYRHDPTVLVELPARLNRKDWIAERVLGNNPQAAVALRVVVGRLLLQWPGHEALAAEAFRQPEDLREKLRPTMGPDMLTMFDFLQARVATQLGDGPAAAALLSGIGQRLTPPRARREAASRTNAINPELVRRCLGLMLCAGPAADRAYLELFNRIDDGSKAAKEYDPGYRLEKTQRTGEDGHYAALAWLLDDGGDNGPDATLVYELRAGRPDDREGRENRLTSRGRSFPGSEGERTLTFRYGRDERHTEPIGQLKTASTFGTWRGPVPPGAGVLQVAIDTPRPQDAKALAGERADKGYPLRIVRAANLWVNPDFAGLPNRDSEAAKFTLPGWKDLPAGFWLAGTLDGPLPGKGYVQCELFPHAETTIYGERIAVEAGKAYYQSAWLRDAWDGGRVSCGRRYLDAAGEVLKSSECPDYPALTWRQRSQRLSADGEGTDDRIPKGTAFIEPFVSFNGGAAWTGLFLGKME